ncbi:MAG: hypothetical protein AB7P01_01915 [Bacteroidia bacterium]
MDFLLVIPSLNIQLIFLFKREWLLKNRTLIFLLIINILLFVIAVFFEEKEIIVSKMIPLLKMPFVSISIWIIYLFLFRFFLQRDPKDTFSRSHMPMTIDGVCNVLFFYFSMLISGLLMWLRIL